MNNKKIFIIFFIITIIIVVCAEADINNNLDIKVFTAKGGKVVFVVHDGLKPVSNIKIMINGEYRGITDKNGTFKAEWLLHGKYFWDAYIVEDKIASGKFNIKKIIAIELLNFYLEQDGKIVQGVYPLSNKNVSANWIFKNTGTTVVKSFNWKMTTTPSSDDLDVDIIKPKIISAVPVGLFKTWMVEMFITEMERNLSIDKGDMTWRNIHNNDCVRFSVTSPFRAKGKKINTPSGFKGLMPGEVIEIHEKRPYVEWVMENIHNKAAELGLKMNLVVMDGEEGLASCFLDEWGFGIFRFKHIEATVQLKGPVYGLHEIFIDRKLYHSLDLHYEYYCNNVKS